MAHTHGIRWHQIVGQEYPILIDIKAAVDAIGPTTLGFTRRTHPNHETQSPSYHRNAFKLTQRSKQRHAEKQHVLQCHITTLERGSHQRICQALPSTTPSKLIVKFLAQAGRAYLINTSSRCHITNKSQILHCSPPSSTFLAWNFGFLYAPTRLSGKDV